MSNVKLFDPEAVTPRLDEYGANIVYWNEYRRLLALYRHAKLEGMREAIEAIDEYTEVSFAVPEAFGLNAAKKAIHAKILAREQALGQEVLAVIPEDSSQEEHDEQ